jgi:hypothetical protein
MDLINLYLTVADWWRYDTIAVDAFTIYFACLLWVAVKYFADPSKNHLIIELYAVNII